MVCGGYWKRIRRGVTEDGNGRKKKNGRTGSIIAGDDSEARTGFRGGI